MVLYQMKKREMRKNAKKTMNPTPKDLYNQYKQMQKSQSTTSLGFFKPDLMSK